MKAPKAVSIKIAVGKPKMPKTPVAKTNAMNPMPNPSLVKKTKTITPMAPAPLPKVKTKKTKMY